MVTKKGVHYAGYGSQIIRIFVKTLPAQSGSNRHTGDCPDFLLYLSVYGVDQVYPRLYSVEGNSDSTPFYFIFQPELRKMLEQLGQKKFMASIFPLDAGKEVQERFTDKTINELVKACFDMGEVRTGALIVIEQNIRLSEYERTGINVDAVLTSQLLINIFEHNTPLHDGAVLVRGNRIVAATCYLPLSDNMELSKQLGTRHRAGVGISEVSDSLTIIVSEETGQVSMAQNGQLSRGLTSAELRSALIKAQNKKVVTNSKLRHLLKGRMRHEEDKAD